VQEVASQDRCKVASQAGSLEVSQVASLVDSGEDSGNSPRYHNSNGLAREEASGARLRHNLSSPSSLSSLSLSSLSLSSLSLSSLSLSSLSSLNLHRQGQSQLLLRLRDPQ
jgi:hypothetical protein